MRGRLSIPLRQAHAPSPQSWEILRAVPAQLRPASSLHGVANPKKRCTTAISFASCSSAVTCATDTSISSHQESGIDGSGHRIQPAAHSPPSMFPSYDRSGSRRLGRLGIADMAAPVQTTCGGFYSRFWGGTAWWCLHDMTLDA